MLLNEEQLTKEYDVPEIVNQTNPELNPTTFEVLGSAMRQENVVSSFFANKPYKEWFSQQEIDNDFDVVKAAEDRGLDNYLVNFAEAFNENEFNRIANNIDRELYDREVLSSAGWGGFASQIIAGAADPINFVPIGGAAVKGIKAKGFLQASIKTAAIAAPSIALQESLLNTTQETRTLGESVVNVTVGTMLSGVLGGAVHSAFNTDFKGLKSKTEAAIFAPENTKLAEAEKDFYAEFTGDNSVGAAVAFETTLKQESLAPSLGTATVTKGLTPMLRLAHSPVKGVREFSQKLIDNPIYFNKNFEGIASPQAVENLKFEQEVRAASVRTGFIEQFKEHKLAARKSGVKSLNKKSFNEAVSYALRNGDIGADDSITKLAKQIRNDVLEPLKKRAIEQKLLPEDVDVATADSYFTRLWSKEKLITKQAEFKKVLKQDFLKKVGKIKRAKTVGFDKKINKLKKSKIEKSKKKLIEVEFEKRHALEEFEGEFLEDYLNDIVDSVYDRITGSTRTPFAHEVTIAEHGSLKERTLDIMDNKVQDFLENDAELVLELHNRSMTGQLLLQEQFGTIDFDEAMKNVDVEFNDFKRTITDSKKLTKVEKQYRSNKRDLKNLWDLTNGTYKSAKDYDNAFIKGMQDVRTINYMRMLHDVTRSSMADVGNIVMGNGFKNIFGDLLIPVITNLKKRKLAVEELRSAGLVWESLLNSRIQTIAEIGDPTARGSYFSRSINNMSTMFTQGTLITQWNDVMKASSGILSQSKILKASRDLASGKKLNKNLIAELRWMGLNNSQLRAISREFKKHGDSGRGVLLSGVNKWDDQGLARSFRAALNKNVNATIVTKGLGDVPMFMNSEIGKTVGQFQSFSFAANQRITVRAAQRMAKGDLAVVQGIASAITIGMLVAHLKAETYKKSAEARGVNTRNLGSDHWTTEKWITEGIDRSGLIPVLMMFNNAFEKIGLPGLSKGLGYATGSDVAPASRYAARSLPQTLLGPSLGTVADTASIINSVSSSMQTGKPVTENDIHRIRKMIPFQGMVGIRRIFDEAERLINE